MKDVNLESRLVVRRAVTQCSRPYPEFMCEYVHIHQLIIVFKKGRREGKKGFIMKVNWESRAVS